MMRKILKCWFIYKKEKNKTRYGNKGIGSNKLNCLLKKKQDIQQKKRTFRKDSCYMNTDGKTTHRSIADVARTIAMSIVDFLKGLMLLCIIRLWKRSWDMTLWVLLCHYICVILRG
jgi:hypothetical protein